MHLPKTCVICYTKFQNDKRKIQIGCWQKRLDKNYVQKKNCAKTVLQCRIHKASKTDVNGQEAKAKVQTIAKYIQLMPGLEQVPKGARQKQVNVKWQ